MSDGPILHGQLFDPQRGTTIRFREQQQDYSGEDSARLTGSEGTANLEQVPTDRAAAKVKIFDLDQFALDNKTVYFRNAGSVNLVGQLPRTLTAVDIVWNTGEASATGTGVTLTSEFTWGGTVSSRPHASAQGSASVMPAMIPTYAPLWCTNVPTDEYSFYVGVQHDRAKLRARVTRFAVTGVTFTAATNDVITAASGSYTNGDQLALTTTATLPAPLVEDTVYYVINVSGATFKLSLTSGGSAIDITTIGTGTHTLRAVVRDWPHFKPEEVTIKLLGMDVSVQATANSTASVTAPATGDGHIVLREKDESAAKSLTLTTRTETIEATLHGAITIGNTSLPSKVATATVTANTLELTGGDGTAAAISNAPTATSLTAVGSTTTTLAATSPYTDIPRTGVYFFDSNVGITEYGQSFVTVRLIDMSYFA